ncbi:MAG: Flp family type IVb pilin [Geminicoccaceae bacterium]|nr:Flp family type IVb pilin [Geminicoccaceae bacterium]
MNAIKHLIRDENGATAIEYGLIAALVSVAILAILSQIGDQLVTTFTSIEESLDAGNSAASGSGSGSGT